MALRPEPAAPIDEHAVTVDPQHAPLDVVGIANGEAIAWADMAHLLQGTDVSRVDGTLTAEGGPVLLYLNDPATWPARLSSGLDCARSTRAAGGAARRGWRWRPARTAAVTAHGSTSVGTAMMGQPATRVILPFRTRTVTLVHVGHIH
jgi:hypothetical protein